MTYVPPKFEAIEFARDDIITTSLNLPLFPFSFQKRYSAKNPFLTDEDGNPFENGDGYWY